MTHVKKARANSLLVDEPHYEALWKLPVDWQPTYYRNGRMAIRSALFLNIFGSGRRVSSFTQIGDATMHGIKDFLFLDKDVYTRRFGILKEEGHGNPRIEGEPRCRHTKHLILCKECRWPAFQEDMNWDHIIPESMGGKRVLRNMQWLCWHCNVLKKDMPYAEFQRSRDERIKKTELSSRLEKCPGWSMEVNPGGEVLHHHCGKMKHPKYMTEEHIIPRWIFKQPRVWRQHFMPEVRGKEVDDPDNLEKLCKFCNGRKNSRYRGLTRGQWLKKVEVPMKPRIHKGKIVSV